MNSAGILLMRASDPSDPLHQSITERAAFVGGLIEDGPEQHQQHDRHWYE